MLRKIRKESVTHDNSRSIFSSLWTLPRATKPAAESQTVNRPTLPRPDEAGWRSDRSGSRNGTPISERQKQDIYITSGSRVLLAEDDMVLRFLFSDALREKGLYVLSAANGLEALELYRENADSIRLVITDIMMPGMDGLTAAAEMRKIDKNLLFLFMSGHDPRAIAEAGLNIEDISDSNFYQKPFAFTDIIGRIRVAAPYPWE